MFSTLRRFSAARARALAVLASARFSALDLTAAAAALPGEPADLAGEPADLAAVLVDLAGWPALGLLGAEPPRGLATRSVTGTRYAINLTAVTRSDKPGS